KVALIKPPYGVAWVVTPQWIAGNDRANSGVAPVVAGLRRAVLLNCGADTRAKHLTENHVATLGQFSLSRPKGNRHGRLDPDLIPVLVENRAEIRSAGPEVPFASRRLNSS